MRNSCEWKYVVTDVRGNKFFSALSIVNTNRQYFFSFPIEGGHFFIDVLFGPHLHREQTPFENLSLMPECVSQISTYYLDPVPP